jgi:hypothetical protein
MRPVRALALLATATLVGCLDEPEDCGIQFIASSNGAEGVTKTGEVRRVTIDDQPIHHTWCLTPEESALMAFENSWIYIQIHGQIVDACVERSIELELDENNCEFQASISYSGPCSGERSWCDDEVGTPP